MTSIVQNWLDGTWDNNGFLLATDNPNPASNNWVRFYSSDYTTDTNLTPKLTLSYHAEIDPPVPAQTFNEDDPVRNIDLSGRGHGTMEHVSFTNLGPGGIVVPFACVWTPQLHVQFLYTAAQVGAEGVITRISFNKELFMDRTGWLGNFRIRMGHTNLTSLSDTFDLNHYGYLVEVFPTQLIFVNASDNNNWLPFDLNHNFTYDSSHNLIIDISWNGGGGQNVPVRYASPGAYPNTELRDLTGAAPTGILWDTLPQITFFVDVVDNGIIDNATSSVTAFPFNPGAAAESHNQILLNSSWVNESGIIDILRFQCPTAGVDWVVVENVSIRLAHSTNSSLGTIFEAHRSSAWVEVLNESSISLSHTGGREWVGIDVANIFNYNGVDNLLIDIRWRGGYGVDGTMNLQIQQPTSYTGFLRSSSLASTTGTTWDRHYNLQTIFLESADLSWSAASSDLTLFTAGVSGRTLQITPVADANGAGSVTLTLRNTDGYNVSQSILVTINAVNDAPVLSGVPASINCTEDVDFILNMTSYASDIDNDFSEFTFSTDSVYAFTAGGPEITFNYPEGITSDHVNITVRDPGGLTDTVTISVTITPVNDVPQLTGFVGTFNCDATIAKTYTVHPVDEETVTDQLVIYTSSTHANVTNHAISFLYPKGIGSESVTIYLIDENIYGSQNNISYVLAVTINDHPEVTAHSPNGTGVAVTTTIEVTFDMAMNDTATENAFSLTYGTTYINGTFSWNAGNTTMTFTPAAHLTNGVYDVSVGTGARSGTGIAPLEAYSWNFTAALGNYDGDGDGMPDQYEIDNGLDPDTDDSTMDKDGDGLPNIWEYQNDLDPSVNDAGLDPDGDGFSNLDEYQAGTDPNDLNDKPYSFPMLLVLLIVIIVIVAALAAILLKRRGDRTRGREAEQFDEDPYSEAEAGESMQEPGTPPGEPEVGEPSEHQEGSPPPPSPTQEGSPPPPPPTQEGSPPPPPSTEDV